MESVYTALIFLLLLLAIGVPYWIRVVRERQKAALSREKSERAGLHEPATLHPRIDLLTCIGCASCVRVCPEDVLGIVEGRAAIVHGMRCVGHALCAEACPVGAITMGFGKPKQGMEIPLYDNNYMTNIEGLYIVGELGGVGLIKNALTQSKKAVEHVVASVNSHPSPLTPPVPTLAGQSPAVKEHNNNYYDLIIVGAGPAGIGAALSAQEKGLNYIVLEQGDLGGSILHYPRQKVALTSPVELPLYGKLNVTEISKENLLSLFNELIERFTLNVACNHKVEEIIKKENFFHVHSSSKQLIAKHIILALGRRGSPRKLGAPGEELPKVAYRLIDAESYKHKNILIVGGGDSAVEAAVGLAKQEGNTVTLSYRRSSFVRLKEKNETRIAMMIKTGVVKALFDSEVKEIKPDVVSLSAHSVVTTLPNDFVFIFAGGELPADFLKKIGVKMRVEEFS